MSDIPAIREGLIQEQETQFTAAVSEYTWRRMGSNMNFCLTYLLPSREFKMNNAVSSFGGKNGVDNIFEFPVDAEIVDIVVCANEMGTAGTCEYDIKKSTAWDGLSFGAWTSILSTTAQISTTAPAFTSFRIGSTVTGTTAPVLATNPTTVNAGDRIRLDVLNVQSGGAKNHSVTVFFKPL